ncbi:hypothetical protein CGI93_23465 [Vibrio parahaemolyticus]|uniref:hypothetical protein n=1 Tax=Vibrio parahaemolyticus TaxID=670 RepID=UPI00112185E2|nr:hypothetical protein [Vibrio parahaemolyticus]MCG9638310.1 hypothetical protein [Vibrio parahaemolyticus]TOG79763.1 hypothetical protein CGI93_23465 [Vibrio parahaemolyticus]HCK0618576.1 hypothetical protein [Vibrio parahaemolyticus]
MLFFNDTSRNSASFQAVKVIRVRRATFTSVTRKIGLSKTDFEVSLIDYYRSAYIAPSVVKQQITPRLQKRVMRAKQARKSKNITVVVKGDERFAGFD